MTFYEKCTIFILFVPRQIYKLRTSFRRHQQTFVDVEKTNKKKPWQFQLVVLVIASNTNYRESSF